MIKKKEINCRVKSKISEKNIKKEKEEQNKIYQKKMTKLKVNLSSSLKFIQKKKSHKKDKMNINNKNQTTSKLKNSLIQSLLLNNLKKYNSNPIANKAMIITNLIDCKPTHYLAVFKDYLINDYVEEFFKRIYYFNESIDRIPNLFNYYKNYLNFFCKPTFRENFFNIIVKNYSDLQAENFYKNNIENINQDKNQIIEIEENDNVYKNEFNINDKNEVFIKTIFTKSIKNSIDNINDEDYKKYNNKNNDSILDKKQESTIIFDNNNKISEGNTLLLMINEMKEKHKQKTNQKNINMKKNINNRNKKIFSIKSTYKTFISNNNVNNNRKTFNNYNKNKINTYSNIKYVDSIKLLGSSEKPKKMDKFKIKKTISKKDKILNNKSKNHHNSTVVNFNINTNPNSNGNNINQYKFKSPKNISTKNKLNKLPLSPLILNILNDKEFHKRKEPLSSRINKDKIEQNNYIKIIKRKSNDNLKIATTINKNKKVFDFKNIKSLDYLDVNESKKKQNHSCNKEILSYNSKKNINKIKKIKYRNINNEYSINKANFEIFTRYNTVNKSTSPSCSNFGFCKTKYTDSVKSFIKVKEAKIKKSIYQRNKYRGIISPLHRNTMDNKFYSYKRLNENNIYNNIN